MNEVTPAPAGAPSPFAGSDWFDPLEEAVRSHVRALIEQLLEEELEAALGRGRYERGAISNGRRHGHGPRQPVTTFAAQPGGSQGRPATNASSQLMIRIGLPTLHAPSAPRPGWSHHTRGSKRSPPSRRAPRRQYRMGPARCRPDDMVEANRARTIRPVSHRHPIGRPWVRIVARNDRERSGSIHKPPPPAFGDRAR